jgi:Zn-finger protein
MLPKFLLADNSQELPDTIFVVHNEYPRFIVESDVDDFWSNQVIHWVDDQPESEVIIEQLLAEAEDFLEEEFNNQEDLYDEEFGVN